MKILLVRYHDGPDINTRLPKSLNKIRGVMPPLGILSLAAYLESFDYSVKIIDAVAECLTDRDFEAAVENYKPDICGVTTMLENYFGASYACKIAKKHGAVVVLGGPGLESYPKEMIDAEYIDFGVIGEGEETFLSLIKALEKKDAGALKNIPGLSYKVGGEVIPGKPQVFQELDRLPMPAYHLININNYSSLINDFPIMTYMMGRGCPFQCSFCIKQASDKSIRFRSPKLVVDDIQHLVKKHKIKEFLFYDDTFTLSIQQVKGVCEEILRRGLKVKFEAPTRIDNINSREGEDLLRLLKSAGCYRLRLGVESGDTNILKSMNKKIDLGEAEIAFKRCHAAGIQTFAYFIVGYLGENRETFNNTLNFAIKLNPDYAMFTIATPYPKTKLYEDSFAAGIIPRDYWNDFIAGKTKERIPYLVPQAEELAKDAYRSFYFRISYIIKRLSLIKSRQHIKNALQGFSGILQYRN